MSECVCSRRIEAPGNDLDGLIIHEHDCAWLSAWLGWADEEAEAEGDRNWSREPTVGELGIAGPPQLTWEDYGWTGAPPGAGASMDWISDYEEDCND